MKASLKFREDEKPLFRAKVPLNILGLPFQSSLAAGQAKELCLSLGTFFDSGPAFRFAYRPNDSSNPFSLILKTGIGNFGSPIDAPMTMSAEFNLVGSASSSSRPTFFIHFKPRFGDFSIKKSHVASVDNPVEFYTNKATAAVVASGFSEIDIDGSIEVVEKSDYMTSDSGHIRNTNKTNGVLSMSTIKNLSSRSLSSAVGAGVDNALTAMELRARTAMPIRNGAVLKFSWGVKFPEDFKSLFNKDKKKEGLTKSTAEINPRKIPLLVMNKISIEHEAKVRSTDSPSLKVGPGVDNSTGIELGQSCFGVKRQLEALQVDNGRLRQAVDDLRMEFANSSRQMSGKNDRRIGSERMDADASVETSNP